MVYIVYTQSSSTRSWAWILIGRFPDENYGLSRSGKLR